MHFSLRAASAVFAVLAPGFAARASHLERAASQPDLLTDILKPLAPGAARSN